MKKIKKMKKRLAVFLAAALVLIACGALAEQVTAPAAQADEFAAQREAAVAAMKVSLPTAELDYAVRERDDGRWEWNLFYKQDGMLGVCKVREESNEIRRVELFNPPANGLTASEAMAALEKEKGEMTVTELELDWDDGVLCYEGNAEMNGRRYEFEITAEGRIVEWERD